MSQEKKEEERAAQDRAESNSRASSSDSGGKPNPADKILEGLVRLDIAPANQQVSDYSPVKASAPLLHESLSIMCESGSHTRARASA